MMRKTGFGFLAAVGLVAGSFVTVPVEPAQAQNFFDRLFGSENVSNRGQGRGYWDRGGRRTNYRWTRQYRADDDEIPVRIAAPKYHLYQPDALKRISLADLAKVETASADQSSVPIEVSPFAEARGHLSSMAIRALPEVGKAMLEHYAKSPHFLWITDGRINVAARSAIAAMARADRFGLSPDDYRVDMPNDAAVLADQTDDEADPAAHQEALMRFEMTLTAAVATYVLDATRGRIDPNRISGYHDFKRKDVNLAAALGVIATSADVAGYLETRHPANAPFKALTAALAELRATDETQKVEIAPGTLLKLGTVDPEVANVIKAIRLRGSDALKTTHAATFDAYAGGEEYTAELVALVRDYQREAGLKADGIVGRGTIGSLTFVSAQDKIAKATLAMERLRWLPRNLGERHVFINQPAYTATYMSPERAPLTMKVVVGKKANQTNFFMDKIETVEFNPYWGVPLSIIANEMLPKLSENPYYLDDIGYEVTTLQGQQVSSAEVDWYAVATKKAMINVRQPPGAKNALGELKILFPNAHAIYMHDTPAKNLFKRQSRAFSHGCVRLEDPRAMAAAVLGKTKDYIASRIAQGENESDKVKADIPVYVSYFTAWPTPEGKVRYYDDMYERDKYLTRAIDATVRTRQVQG